MLSCETRHTVHQGHAKGMDGKALHRRFLTPEMFADGELRQIYAHYRYFVTESCQMVLSYFSRQIRSVRHTTATAWRRICIARGLQKAVLCF